MRISPNLRRIFALMLVFSFIVPIISGAQQKQNISLLLVNGKIFTADARGTIAEAVAVDSERIIAVGTTKELKSRFNAARTVDVQGKLVTPGFNDAHLHFLNGGESLLQVDLQSATSLAEVKGRIAARVKELPKGAWLTGRGWDHTLWGAEFKNKLPSRQDLDDITHDNPVLLGRVDGHISWANSLALKQAGITRATANPKGGEIEHDATGEPTGILKETAVELVRKIVPEFSHAQMLLAIQSALDLAKRVGVTSIQDNSGYETTKLYRELLRQGKLSVRVAEWQNFDDSIAELKRQRIEFASFKDDPRRLKLTALKGYMDGSLGSRTAALLAPYADDPHNSGIPRRPAEETIRMIVERDQAGFQIALHAIGDRANTIALDGFAAAHKKRLERSSTANRQINEDPRLSNPATRDIDPSPSNDVVPRHRIEHAQIVAPSDFARFRALNIIASMQPTHAITDKRWAESRLGTERVKGAYAWHTMLADKIHLAFGTDFPVEPLTPYRGLYAAVTRRSAENFQPPNGWQPQEKISIVEAIKSYTVESAYASFDEKEKGQIAVGMLADFVVHSRDLLTIKPEEILQTEAVLT
ncbi:MAG: amidohydrolase [Pyrinomonadaceae bacterium]